MDPMERQRERELAIRRENERKDLDVESDHSERPLEGFSGAGTTWSPDQDDSQRAVHEGDQAASRHASEDQVMPAPADRSLPAEGTPDA